MDVAIYLYDGVTALDAVGPYDLLNRLPDTAVLMVGDGAGAKQAQGGLSLVAARDLDDMPTPDVVVVPGGGARLAEQLGNQRLKDWLRQSSDSATWVTSVCTGALILGASGLLDGRQATTHWRARDYLAGYGATYVDERVVEDGKVMTGAGVTAGLDMALTLAGRLAGDQMGRAIQLSAHYDPHPPFPVEHHTTATDLLPIINDELGPD